MSVSYSRLIALLYVGCALSVLGHSNPH